MNRFIVADAQKCIGCRTCEAACAVSHQAHTSPSVAGFTPRIRVVKDSQLSAPVACHQCEDAPCGNACPTGAIRRDFGHIFVEQSLCIGCKSCMLACPFGAMQVVVQQERVQAIKCDLCWQRESGPACVEACPTRAIECVDPGRLRAARLRAARISG